jgi:hypothetical protein
MGKFIDFTGQRFGRLTVVERAENTKDNKAQWLCLCDCGNTKVVRASHLKKAEIKSCGCLNAPDLSGEVFGRLTVLNRAASKNGVGYFLCRCSCGNEIEVRTSHLVNGNTKSCGCYNQDVRTSNRKQNKYEINGNITTMYTTKGEPFLIDTEDLDKVLAYCWYKNPDNYIVTMRNRKNIQLHNIIIDCPKGMYVDHRFGDPTDNRKCMLRLATIEQNACNRKEIIGTVSGYTGVYLNGKKWRARITYNGKRINLGSYDTLDEAVAARHAAEDKYFGEYSRRKSRGE